MELAALSLLLESVDFSRLSALAALGGLERVRGTGGTDKAAEHTLQVSLPLETHSHPGQLRTVHTWYGRWPLLYVTLDLAFS